MQTDARDEQSKNTHGSISVREGGREIDTSDDQYRNAQPSIRKSPAGQRRGGRSESIRVGKRHVMRIESASVGVRERVSGEAL
jgi:hypothetical protein